MRHLTGSAFPFSLLGKNREWYHQRFDAAPIFLFTIADAEMVREKRKPAGAYPQIRLCFFSNGRADWYLEATDLRRAANALVDLARRDPNISSTLRRAWQGDERRFEDFVWKEFPKINLTSLNKTQLRRLWTRYYKLVVACLSSTGIIDHFALGTDDLIHEMIRREVQAQTAGKLWTETELAEVFTIATAPVCRSFLNQAEIDLLRIATGRSKRTLRQYQRQYFWLRNNYLSSRTISMTEFEQKIGTQDDERGLDAELHRIEEAPKQNEARKKTLFRRYRFSLLLRTLLKVSEDFTAWQDARKRATFLHAYVGSKLLEEIGHCSGYALEQLKYVTGFEVEKLISENRPTVEELEARMQGSVFLATPEGYYVGKGAEVEMARKMMRGPERRELHDFRGLAASLGKVRGKVAIVGSSSEITRVAQGDVLVAVMTRPDYIAGMKRACAIVTNEGGITSHASIVSRELGIPCIIGTKIATEVLLDGDWIEVDANLGTVTILQRASDRIAPGRDLSR